MVVGAIIGGAITVYLVCRHKKIPPLKVMDAVAPGVMIGQILGRWGNFCNGEAYGYEVTEGSLLYPLRMGLLPNIESRTEMHYFHPTFFYESTWNLIGFLIINALYKKKKFDGQILLMYLGWYGFGRMFIEGLRTDSLYLFANIRISQLVGFVCFVACSVLLIVFLAKAHQAKKTEEEAYTPAYPNISTTISAEAVENAGEENGKDIFECSENTDEEQENVE